MQRRVLRKKMWSISSIASADWSKMNTETKILDLARWRWLLATMTRVVSVAEKRVGGKNREHFSWSDTLIHINIHMVRVSYHFLSPHRNFLLCGIKNMWLSRDNYSLVFTLLSTLSWVMFMHQWLEFNKIDL